MNDLLAPLKPGERFHPHTIPLHLVDRLVRAYDLKLFVESGTYLGFTVEHVHEKFERVETIELDAKLAATAHWKFEHAKNVHVRCGDSRALLGEVLAGESRRALIWLDAHYSGGVTTGKGNESDTPIREELAVLKWLARCGDVLLIDDIDDFNGERGYPTVEELKKLIGEINSAYRIEILPLRRGVLVALPAI